MSRLISKNITYKIAGLLAPLSSLFSAHNQNRELSFPHLPFLILSRTKQKRLVTLRGYLCNITPKFTLRKKWRLCLSGNYPTSLGVFYWLQNSVKSLMYETYVREHIGVSCC